MVESNAQGHAAPTLITLDDCRQSLAPAVFVHKDRRQQSLVSIRFKSVIPALKHHTKTARRLSVGHRGGTPAGLSPRHFRRRLTASGH